MTLPPIEGIRLDEHRPLSPRSLALSVLLGTHPPSLPVRAFMRLADEFGIAHGTMRTALSRLVAAGELTLSEGRYQLGAPLTARQQAQDLGRSDHDDAWDGSWHTIIAVDDQREQAERRRFRSVMTDAHFGMLRADIWMRPANLPLAPPFDDSWICTTGPIAGPDPDELVSRLWPLDELAPQATQLTDVLRHVRSSPDVPTRTVFLSAAAALRCLRRDPLLPIDLTPPGWPMNQLRREYARTETALQTRLRHLFARELSA